MAMITLTSKCNTSLSQTLPYPSNNNNFRDASFSSYLNSPGEKFVRKPAAPSQNQSPISATQEEKHFPERKEQEDEEIGVFSAEKYFKGVMDDSPRIVKVGARNYHCVKDERVDPVVVKPRTQAGIGTPSVRSESSWNSQSALLQSVLKNNPTQKRTNKGQGKRFLSGLRCKCSCSDKDSVDIERVGETSFKRSTESGIVQGKANSSEANRTTQLVDTVQMDKPGSVVKEDHVVGRENCFSFPSMNSEMGNLPIKVNLQEVEEEKTRKSLEVFGCPVFEKKDKSRSLERRLTMLSWDATPTLDEIQLSGGEIYNETESDASSDLFEIESLTGKSNPFLARQGSDATSGCVTPTAYAPSEASIEWSVVTASAADFSTMSDCEDLRPPTTAASPVKTFSTSFNAKNRTATTEMTKRRPSISLGCKSHKTVRVAGDAHLMNQKANFDPRMRRISDSFAPVMTRFQSETKLTGFDPRPRQNALAATRSLPRSYSPRASHLLYIQ